MIIKSFTLYWIIILVNISFAQSLTPHHSKADIYCKECHSCESPTERDPCLICCPDFKRKNITIQHSIKKAPQTITIDVIKKEYEASIFSHKKHAEMADMSMGCVLCHHFNPPGDPVACKECHKATRQRINLRKPDLKAAYHRQCLGCHLEWKHENDCLHCHALKNSTTEKKLLPASKEKKPRIILPIKKVYTTDFDEGKLVTFYHLDHAKLYSIECGDCHKNEKCANCHDLKKQNTATEKEPHENCVTCHNNEIEEKCNKCHAEKELPPFNHGKKTGWVLKTYHQLKCTACHKSTGKFSKLKRDCKVCHKKWEYEKFNHKIVGFTFDENHEDIECAMCHEGENFLKKPYCSECHEEEIQYPRSKPGKKL